jgi:hypothetical protein
VILGIWPTLVTRPLEPLLENQIQARLLDPSARRTAWGGKSEFRSLKSEVKSNAPGIWPFTLAELELQTPSFPLQTSRELQNSPLQNSPSFAGGAP